MLGFARANIDVDFRFLYAGVRPVTRMDGADVLAQAEMEFLQAVINSRDRPTKRRATVQIGPVCPALADLLKNNTPADLLSLPPWSDLDISGLGPRAAGRL